ncbi:MAG: LysM peptidoglycan-binding domain-containing protein, partial [Anaerolineae bacterium]|nr:LysM peptidoglycan-binding domain-containing protein [Anaerolineae bacterium]
MRNRIIRILCVAMLLLPVVIHAQNTQPTVTLHVVQRGENLYRIAQTYGVTVDDLVRLNGLTDPGSIDIGQRLLVPTAGVPVDGTSLVHVVQPGESLDSIGALYGMTGVEVQSLNGLPDGVIYVGQGLMVS